LRCGLFTGQIFQTKEQSVTPSHPKKTSTASTSKTSDAYVSTKSASCRQHRPASGKCWNAAVILFWCISSANKNKVSRVANSNGPKPSLAFRSRNLCQDRSCLREIEERGLADGHAAPHWPQTRKAGRYFLGSFTRRLLFASADVSCIVTTGDATVIQTHRYTPREHLTMLAKTADIIIAAAGKFWRARQIMVRAAGFDPGRSFCFGGYVFPSVRRILTSHLTLASDCRSIFLSSIALRNCCSDPSQLSPLKRPLPYCSTATDIL